MKEIKDAHSYEAIFSQRIIGRKNWREAALEHALDIRKFEIDLYWKRASYFWGLIAASFAGYFLLQNAEPCKRNHSSVFIISCIGFMLSFAWYLVNRGSKYWQQNWERHVDVLAETIIGPLYRTTLSKGAWWFIFKPHEAFPFSVSRVNQIVSLFVTVLWAGLALRAFPSWPRAWLTGITPYWVMALFTVTFAILLLWLAWPKKSEATRPVTFDISRLGGDESVVPPHGKSTTSDAMSGETTRRDAKFT
jgi:hypothetical protein